MPAPGERSSALSLGWRSVIVRGFAVWFSAQRTIVLWRSRSIAECVSAAIARGEYRDNKFREYGRTAHGVQRHGDYVLSDSESIYAVSVCTVSLILYYSSSFLPLFFAFFLFLSTLLSPRLSLHAEKRYRRNDGTVNGDPRAPLWHIALSITSWLDDNNAILYSTATRMATPSQFADDAAV